MAFAVTVERNALHRALRQATRTMRSDGHIPILKHVKIDARANRLHIAGTNMDAWIETSVPAEVAEEGITTAAGDRLSRLVQGFADGAEVSLQHTDRSLQIKSGRSRVTLPTLDPDEWPTAAPDKTARAVTTTVGALRGALLFCRDAADPKDARTFAHGVGIECINGAFNAVATDGANLACYDFLASAAEGKIPDVAITIPLPTVDAILEAMPKDGAVAVALGVGERLFTVDVGDVAITSRLIDAIWPEWRRIIPADPNYTLRIDAEAFQGALSRIAAVTDRATIHLSSDGNGEAHMFARGVHESAPGVEVSEAIEASATRDFATGLLPSRMIETIEAIRRAEPSSSIIELHGDATERTAIRLNAPGRTDFMRLYMPCVARGPDQ